LTVKQIMIDRNKKNLINSNEILKGNWNKMPVTVWGRWFWGEDKDNAFTQSSNTGFGANPGL